MHISLDAALQRQPLLSTVGDKLLPTFPGAAAAYSLRALNGDANNVVNVRRDADDEERDFTAEGVALELEDWVNGKLETTLPADSSFGGAADAYSLRKVNPDYTGNAVQIRRASDDVEVNVAFDSNGEVSDSSAITNVVESPDAGDTTATTLGAFLTEETIAYESDFSAGTDGWSDNNGFATFTGNQDGVGGRDDLLKIENTAGTTRQIRPSNNTAIPHDGTFRLTLDVYRVGGTGVPAYIGTYSGNAGATQNPSVSTEMTEDQWVTIDFGNLTYENYTRFNLFFSASPDSTTVSGVADGGTIYFRNAKVTTVANDATVVTWYDQSGSGNDATQDTAGSQPKIAENGSLLTNGGKTTMDATDAWFSKENFTIGNASGQYSSFAIGQRYIDIAGRAFWGVQTADFWGLTNGANINEINVAGVTATGYNTTSTILHSQFNDGTNTNIFRDGSLAGSGTTTASPYTSPSTNTLRIGAGRFDGRTIASSLQEVLIFNSDQSDNRFKIESNINNYYGLSNVDLAGDFTASGAESFTADGTNGFTLTNSTSTAFAGIELEQALAAGEKIYVSFNLRIDAGANTSPNLTVREGSITGTSATDEPFFIPSEGNNSTSFTSDSGGDAQYISFGENDIDPSTYTISNFRVSKFPFNDGLVETWYDQSGNGNHAVQASTGLQPKIVSAGSLLDELSFDGVDDYMDITSLTTLSNPFTMFQVVDLDNVNITPSAFRPTIDGITTPVHRIITGNAEGSSEDGFFAGTATLSASSIVTDIALRTYFFRGDSTSEYFRNGTSVASGNVGSQTPSSGIRIAADHDLSGSNSQIRFKEFIIYNTDQTANRTAIESNIADEYGITLS